MPATKPKPKQPEKHVAQVSNRPTFGDYFEPALARRLDRLAAEGTIPFPPRRKKK